MDADWDVNLMDEVDKALAKRIIAWIVDKKILYVVLAVSLVLYILTKVIVFAMLVGGTLILMFVLETLHSASKGGWKNEVKELAIAIFSAALLWYGAGFLLGTSAPLDAIVSCSMLPNFDRGDMVLLSGGMANAHEVVVSPERWPTNWSSEHAVCSLCQNGSQVGACARRVRFNGVQLVDLGATNQAGNLIQYECGACQRKNLATGAVTSVPCTKAVVIDGQRFTKNMSNDVIVYRPRPGDSFAASGEIIHRVVVRINVNGTRHYLTWGDNNEQLDLQWVNTPASQDRVTGKVAGRIPYIGYLKLFLFGLFGTPAGCESTML